MQRPAEDREVAAHVEIGTHRSVTRHRHPFAAVGEYVLGFAHSPRWDVGENDGAVRLCDIDRPVGKRPSRLDTEEIDIDDDDADEIAVPSDTRRKCIGTLLRPECEHGATQPSLRRIANETVEPRASFDEGAVGMSEQRAVGKEKGNVFRCRHAGQRACHSLGGNRLRIVLCIEDEERGNGRLPRQKRCHQPVFVEYARKRLALHRQGLAGVGENITLGVLAGHVDGIEDDPKGDGSPHRDQDGAGCPETFLYVRSRMHRRTVPPLTIRASRLVTQSAHVTPWRRKRWPRCDRRDHREGRGAPPADRDSRARHVYRARSQDARR